MTHVDMVRHNAARMLFGVILLSGMQVSWSLGMSFWDAVHNKPPREANIKHWEESAPVFDHESVKEYHITVLDKDWKWLNSHELIEQYIPGNLSFENNTYENVGVRYKGSKGSLEYCFSNPIGKEGSGPFNLRLCKKLSMKLSFNKYDDDQRFYGMKKMNLHAMMNDNSLMRECLAYTLYRTMGVSVPRCAHAKVFVNGKYQGLFMAVEAIDSKFVRTHLDDKDGILYKEVWPGNLQGLEPEYYVKGAASHKSSISEDDVTPIVKFANKLYDSDSTVHVKHLLKKHWDLDSLLNIFVVATVIDDWDSFFTFFPSDPNHQTPSEAIMNLDLPTTSASQSSSSKRLKVVQWDTDITFSEAGPPLAAFLGVPSWDVPLCDPDEDPKENKYCTPCVGFAPSNLPVNSSGILPGACDKIVNAVSTELREKFLMATWDFLEYVFIPEEIEKLILKWADLIRDAHKDDKNYPAGRQLVPGAGMFVKWEDEVARLIDIVGTERDRALMKSNPVYKPQVPQRHDYKQLMQCVTECSVWAKRHGLKSLTTCFNICIAEQEDKPKVLNQERRWYNNSTSFFKK